MNLLELSLPTIEENLAADEALLLEAEKQTTEVMRLWEWPKPAVILGAGCRIHDDVNEGACATDGVPILRRSSGGGTVLLGQGCLCFSLVLSYHHAPELSEIRPAYAYILERARRALRELAPGIECTGTSDLAAAGCKFSGNAQQRKRHHLLHHGTILYDFDLALVSRYLRLPSRQPTYRRQRGHGDFLMNLPVKSPELKRRLRSAWQADSSLTTWPEELVRNLVAEKYSREDWIRRR
ncbi:MAG TPA: lipoate--protein ligase family protein [Gemmataceae bacterium]|nr:lipoate--protein ligase family protein [Gemmataceae bacterium]